MHVVQHVLPSGDKAEHLLNDCPCIPNTSDDDVGDDRVRRTRVVHHRLDGQQRRDWCRISSWIGDMGGAT